MLRIRSRVERNSGAIHGIAGVTSGNANGQWADLPPPDHTGWALGIGYAAFFVDCDGGWAVREPAIAVCEAAVSVVRCS